MTGATRGGLSDLRLGHIVYSNCFPIHARLLDDPRAGDPRMVTGIPSQLNELLERGGIDVAPCSSIEFARNASRYRILPDLVIGSRGPVRSIQFLARAPMADLSGQRVAIPTASATSVVLLKILLHLDEVRDVELVWFDQAREDPFATGASAALFIGDVALRPTLHPELPFRLDLGEAWWQRTGLPFAFAVWQARTEDDEALRALHALLLESRAYGLRNRAALARRHADRFGLSSELLDGYWADLAFDLDRPMLEGLRAFYRHAAAIGEIPEEPELRWV